MLSERLIQEKTYEDLLQEARIQIPLYSKEWTNFNPSDPAVTLLEHISAYSVLQQSYMGRSTEEAKEKMFSLLGYKRTEGKNARVLLEPLQVEEPVVIPSGQRFIVGDLSYETNKEVSLNGNKILGVYVKQNQKLQDCSVILDKEIPLEVSIFTDTPVAGMEFYIVMDGESEIPEELNFYVETANPEYRNPFEGNSLFAGMKWQCYTGKGFMDIRCRDNTGCFTTSGELRFRVPKEKLAIYEELPQQGYVIRGMLTKAEYDIPPRVLGMRGFLFEVWQKETHSICYTFSDKHELHVLCDLLEDHYVQIFCREEDGMYHKYAHATAKETTGRFYEITKNAFGDYNFWFDKNRYGYGPGAFDNAVKIVAYSERLMRQYDLGKIYGYDEQTIELPMENIVKEGFTLILEKKNAQGESIYDFVKPDTHKEGSFSYSLYENEGRIVIHDAADYLNGNLYLCGYATSRGTEGNVRAGTEFIPYLYETDIKFVNPAAGQGGRRKETIVELQNRFVRDLQKHYTAVEAKDYERIVKETPQLCIQKVKAIPDQRKNQVNIAVQPYSKKPFPTLSPIYIKAIMEELSGRRLLGTGIEILQPVYVAVNMYSTIYVKSHFEKCREQIEAVIRKNLDYRSSEHNFGERLNFDTLFHNIEALECVDFIYDLSIVPQNQHHVEMSGMDILPAANCLLYPGEISIQINTME